MKVKFKINYWTQWGESLAIVLQDRKYPMQWGEGGVWSVTVETCAAALKDYGYVVMRDGVITRMEWSGHSSRPAPVIEDSWIDCPIEGCRFTRRHSVEHFDTPGWRGAGTAIPVFSLRSAEDFGIGEFNDLRPLVDWAAATGQSVIQLLPVTDTTRRGGWEDSYPYSPVSSFALHPLYIHLQDIGVETTPGFKSLRDELNSLPELDYPRVFKAKTALMREAYSRRGAADLASAPYLRFYKENAGWLGEYAEFCALRDGDAPEYHAWVQYHLDKQFSKVVSYARGKGISFKGDLPIGVSADSADAHWHPELFNLDCTAGAPPDYFSSNGQNWGFPTYDWEEMARDDYYWWKARLRHMSKYFDAFRIDHILGFFRIWEIPAGCKGGKGGYFNPALPYSREEIDSMGLPLEGIFHPDPRHPGMFQPFISPDTSRLSDGQKRRFDDLYYDFFYHRHDSLWRNNAMRKLPELLGATGMLACGEDLGMVPDCVPGVMDEERILSLKMRGMENEGAWRELSVCATSSHDCATLRMQCAGDPEPGEVRNILSAMLYSRSMLAIFPLQDWLALDPALRRPERNEERINEPADPDHHWRFRMHLDVRELLSASRLNDQILLMVHGSGR